MPQKNKWINMNENTETNVYQAREKLIWTTVIQFTDL